MAELDIAEKLKVMEHVAAIAAAAATNDKMGWSVEHIAELVEKLYPSMVKMIEEDAK